MNAIILEKVQTFFTKYPQRTIPKNETIIFSGEAPEYVFFIVSGKISQYDISYRGDEVVANIFKSPSFFPLAWAINRTPNSYFYKTDEETIVHMAPADDVVQFLKDNPDVMFNLLARVYRGVEGVLARMVRLMSGSALNRITYELVIECRRFGVVGEDGSYTLKINETDLAAHAGLARETVSREIRHLKKSGAIVVSKNGIVVKDIAALGQ